MRYAILFLLCLCLRANSASFTAASASYADVAASVALASSGDTVNVPSGTVTWSSTLDLGTKAIALIGNGTNNTIINNSAPNLLAIKSNTTGSNPVRISGFRFNNADTLGTTVIHFAGPAYKVRVDNCYFERGDCAVGSNQFWAQLGNGAVWGVIDHCIFHNMIRPYYATDSRNGDQAIANPTGYSGAIAWTEAILPGSDHMMVLEDNQFVWDNNPTPPSGNAQGALYGSYGGRATFRYNTLTGNDAAIDAHGDGGSATLGGGDPSTVFYEIYNNTFTYGSLLAQGEAMWQRGGQWIVHDNVLVYPYTSTIHMSVYFVNDAPSRRVKNTYFWGNTSNGSTDQSAIVGTKDSGQAPAGYSAANIRLNQEYFLRAPQAGDVYFPYTPLVYPHPLVSGGTSPAPPPTLTNYFYASAGVIASPFVTNLDYTISQSTTTTDPALGGSATYNFVVPVTGSYSVVGYVSCLTDDANSFFVQINGQPTTSHIWHFPVSGAYEYEPVTWGTNTTPQLWALTGGATNQLIIRGREANAHIGYIVVTIPPAAPSVLAAAAVSISQINLTWTDNSTNETGFRVLRAISADGPFLQIVNTSSNVVSYSDTGLAASQIYHYRVRSNDTYAESLDSNTANATTSQQVSSPSGVAGTPQLMMRRR